MVEEDSIIAMMESKTRSIWKTSELSLIGEGRDEGGVGGRTRENREVGKWTKRTKGASCRNGRVL